MTLAKVKEQDGMMLAKVKEQDGLMLSKVKEQDGMMVANVKVPSILTSARFFVTKTNPVFMATMVSTEVLHVTKHQYTCEGFLQKQ